MKADENYQHLIRLSQVYKAEVDTRCGGRIDYRSPESVMHLPMCPACSDASAMEAMDKELADGGQS